MNTGERAYSSAVSSNDTAIMMCGHTHLPTVFFRTSDRNPWRRTLPASQLAVMLDGGSTFSMGWTPESGFS